MKTPLGKIVKTFIAIIISGLLWYVSNGLNGNLWYLLWIAPIPILLISFHATRKQIFFISFIAYLIGRLSWFSYLVMVATLIPALILSTALALIFACIMVLTRTVVIKSKSWYAVFAYPVFFTAFEFLLIMFSDDGSAASIAYSQSDFLPIIQIASVTGLLGITFIVSFIPSVIALGWHFCNEKSKLLTLTIVAVCILVPIFTFGFIRINSISKVGSIRAGLVVLDEKTHIIHNPDFEKEPLHIANYALEISKLADQGAAIVVLPERAMNINEKIDSTAVGILRSCAIYNQVGIVTGYTNYKGEAAHNSAMAINEQGMVVVDYDKVHLVTGLENQFVSGNKSGAFVFGDVRMGTAICKDLDFPEYIRKYGQNKTSVLYVPAWDFVVDDWLHSRMAIIRGIENGFSIVRTARLGRLTLSDPYGRVTAEANCSNGKATSLMGQVSLQHLNTFYSEYGDWFGWIIVFASIGFIVLIIIKRKLQ